jgi:hypothetical protein
MFESTISRGQNRLAIRARAAWLVCAAALIPAAVAAGDRAPSNLVERGRRIYEEGIQPSGAALQGQRFDGSPVAGIEAACVQCHRRSGMGSKEGDTPAPPVTGKFLFGQARQSVALSDPRSPKNVIQSHTPYTDAALAKTLTQGIDNQGKTLNALMPRYTLDAPSMKALAAYLRQLSIAYSPGVTDSSVRFATVITPGFDPQKRDVMLQMMQTAFRQRNASHSLKGKTTRAQVQEDRRSMRKWELVVWELQGPAETWDQQLEERYRKEPAFAMISGFAGGTWAPVHTFCQREKIPCLFPSVDLPVANDDFYSLYFSGGVALEAAALAKYLLESKDQRPQRLLQLHGDDEVSRGAARILHQAMSQAGILVEERLWGKGEMALMQSPLAGVGGQDTVVFWLRAADLNSLAKATPKLASSAHYFSGTLTGGDPLRIPGEWQRPTACLVSPYETGIQRQRNSRLLHQWLRSFRYPLVDEVFQSEVFFNLVFLSDITMHMLENYYRDYLVERVEDMLGQSPNVTVYPRLSLGQHQRFASKGAYIWRAFESKSKVGPEWIVP